MRMERMLENPLAFYRWTAGLMAMDLARDPHSGIIVAACGDAHISNFGFYASPERKLVFDLNDFDEAGAAPWDWDLKRLVTSVVVGGIHAEYTEREVRKAAQRTVRAYRGALRTMLERNPYERFYMHSNLKFARSLLSADARKVLHHAISAATKRTGQRAVRRTTQLDDDGRLRFVERPPPRGRRRQRRDPLFPAVAAVPRWGSAAAPGEGGRAVSTAALRRHRAAGQQRASCGRAWPG